MVEPLTTFDVLRFLPEERPLAYERLAPEEQAWRGRYFLMCIALDASEEFAWANALNDEPTHNEEIMGLISRTPDHQIVEALKLRNAPGRGEAEEGVSL